ncbi:MAG: hypothetical protein AB1611_05300 [bacterium]
MEVRFKIDDEFMTALEKELQVKNSTDVVREALALLSWAISEKKAKRSVILSTTEDGSDVHRLAMPSLMQIKT